MKPVRKVPCGEERESVGAESEGNERRKGDRGREGEKKTINHL